MTTQDPHDIVCLAKAQNPAQAHIWQQALLDEGIQAKVVGDFLDAGLGDIPGLRAEVWVHRDDVARGEEILKRGQIDHDNDAEDAEDK